MIRILILMLFAFPAWAQAPYAGLDKRAIKSLSEAEIGELRAAQGMKLALPAELNRHPGPRHALELAAELRLDHRQRSETGAIEARMTAATKSAGERVIAAEAELDRIFAQGTPEDAAIAKATAAAGAAWAELRAAHLAAHSAMTRLLTPQQIARYAELRGYGGSDSGAAPAPTHQGHGGHRRH
ncbi:MAG: hypothetical protein FJX46_13960 [Alphaproteobacteria bacterium]|nr:hypothetical protein [Alphaproteobacteria bacterium]